MNGGWQEKVDHTIFEDKIFPKNGQFKHDSINFDQLHILKAMVVSYS